MNRDFYLPIDKVDEETRMVYGYASTTALDAQGDRISLEAMRGSLPDYMRFGNIREMHQPSAVGKAISAVVDETGMYIGAHVVDDVAWKKVKAKVYNGFSIKGSGKREGEWITKLRLVEISLVDRPANPDAVFDVWKMDGTHEGERTMNLKKFGGPENGTEEDVEKLLKASTSKMIEENAGLRKELSEVKTTAGEALALQAKVEELQKNIDDRNEKDLATSMKKVLDGAVAAGKIRAAERTEWEKNFRDLGGARCERILKNMAAVVPMGQRIGAGGDGEESTTERCEKIVQKIMQDEKVTFDVAYSKAYGRNSKLFQQRDAEQLAIAGGGIGGGVEGDAE